MPKNKSKLIYTITIIIIIILIVGFVIYKLVINNNWKNATKAEEIIINEKDTDNVKLEKLQAKIELLNQDIQIIQEKLNIELEKMNSLYEEYISVINEYQIGAPTTETTNITETIE